MIDSTLEVFDSPRHSVISVEKDESLLLLGLSQVYTRRFLSHIANLLFLTARMRSEVIFLGWGIGKCANLKSSEIKIAIEVGSYLLLYI